MKKFLFHLFHETPGGVGSGGGAGTPSGGGSGSGVPSTGAPRGAEGRGTGSGGTGTGPNTGQGPATGGGAGTPFVYADDARIQLSDGRVVTGAEFRQEFSQAAERDARARYQRGYDLLMQEAARIDQGRRGQGQQPQQGQPQDPFADLRNLPVISGSDAVRMIELLQQRGLGPIANTLREIVTRNTQLEQQMRQFSERFGNDDESQAEQQFETELDRTFPNVAIEGVEWKPDPKSEPIREFARNLRLAYHAWRPGEFAKMFTDQFGALVKAVRAMDRQHVETKRAEVRTRFANPSRGNASGNGQARYQFESPRQLAARARESGMFDNRNAT